MSNVVLKVELCGIILERFLSSKLISHYLAIFVYNGAADYASIQLSNQPTHISSYSLNIIMSQKIDALLKS